MRPIKVLHVRDTHEIGGPGKTILETHRFIDRRRFELHLAVFLTRREVGDTPFVAAARRQGLPVHFVSGHNQFDPRLVWRLARLATRLNAGLLHSHEVKSDVICRLAAPLCATRTISTLHGWIENSRKDRFYTWLDKGVVRGFDRVIAVSGKMRSELLAHGVEPERTALLHNAIVLERYRRGAQTGLSQDLFGCRPLPLVVSIGRLSAEKGHADLIEAISILAREGVRVHAVIAGDGPERPRLESMCHARDLGDRVKFAGYLVDPQRLLEDADLMVLPSHTEGLPNVALEAFAMEVPVLATSVGGTPEVVREGETGRLVLPGQPDALAHGIKDYLARPAEWRVMAKAGRRLVEASFSFETRTRRLEELYTEVMSRCAS